MEYLYQYLFDKAIEKFMKKIEKIDQESKYFDHMKSSLGSFYLKELLLLSQNLDLDNSQLCKHFLNKWYFEPEYYNDPECEFFLERIEDLPEDKIIELFNFSIPKEFKINLKSKCPKNDKNKYIRNELLMDVIVDISNQALYLYLKYHSLLHPLSESEEIKIKKEVDKKSPYKASTKMKINFLNKYGLIEKLESEFRGFGHDKPSKILQLIIGDNHANIRRTLSALKSHDYDKNNPSYTSVNIDLDTKIKEILEQ